MTLFISYSSTDADIVAVLERNLEGFGKKVWRDNEVTGGQAWWAAILEQIRECDVFIFALSPNSLESDPCALEFGYARALGLPILPVEISDVPAETRRHHAVYSEQLVDYRNPSADTAIALMRAVGEREAARGPLPDPLPPEPPVPYEYLLRLSTVIRMREPIPYADQRALIGEFRDALNRERNESVRASIRDLLGELKDRPDTSHSVEAEIDELLAKYPPPPPRPAPPVIPVVTIDPAPPAGPPQYDPSTYVPVPPPVPPAAPGEVAQGIPVYGSAYGPADGSPYNPAAGIPPAPPPGTNPGGGGRKLAIILGSVGAVVVIAAAGTAFALWPKGGSTPTPTPTPAAAGVECWDGSDATGIEGCPAFSGADALLYAFPTFDGPDGGEADCEETDPTDDDAADGALVSVYCTWPDIPGTSLWMTEWDKDPDDLMTYWESLEWDEEFDMTISDERIGATWKLATTLDSSGEEVWYWAAVYDDLPFSVDILASADSGGSDDTAAQAWDAFGALTPEEIAALPGVPE
jgi:hypothetical protein